MAPATPESRLRRNGIFKEVTGLSDKTVRNIVKELEKDKLIDVYRGNVIYSKSHKKPVSEVNRYKYNLLSVKTYNTENGNSFTVCNKNCTGCFNACLCRLYSDTQLKEILSRRHYEEVREYKDYCPTAI